MTAPDACEFPARKCATGSATADCCCMAARAKGTWWVVEVPAGIGSAGRPPAIAAKRSGWFGGRWCKCCRESPHCAAITTGAAACAGAGGGGAIFCVENKYALAPCCCTGTGIAPVAVGRRMAANTCAAFGPPLPPTRVWPTGAMGGWCLGAASCAVLVAAPGLLSVACPDIAATEGELLQSAPPAPGKG